MILARYPALSFGCFLQHQSQFLRDPQDPERRLINTHAGCSEQILRISLRKAHPDCLRLVKEHHTPADILEERLRLLCAILFCADVTEAVTDHRTYIERGEMDLQKVRQILISELERAFVQSVTCPFRYPLRLMMSYQVMSSLRVALSNFFDKLGVIVRAPAPEGPATTEFRLLPSASGAVGGERFLLLALSTPRRAQMAYYQRLCRHGPPLNATHVLFLIIVCVIILALFIVPTITRRIRRLFDNCYCERRRR